LEIQNIYRLIQTRGMSISVIIPVFNRAGLIGATLRSLRVQTLPADEVVVVDDGSTDGTAKAVAEAWSGVQVIEQMNGGPAAARNTGFRASRGEFIHFFDSDDLAASNKHEVQMNALQESGADIAICPWIKGEFMADVFSAENHVLQQRGLPNGNLIKALLSTWSFVPHSALFRREIVEKCGGFDESLFVAEDQLMLLNCLLAGAKVIHTPGTVEFYRVGKQDKITESKEWSERRFVDWARFLIKGRAICLSQGIEPLRWLGYRRRLWEAVADLRRIKCNNRQLLEELERLAPKRFSAALCRWHRRLERWRGGLQRRVTGGRAVKSFRMGAITLEQICLLKKLGYGYVPPPTVPWIPKSRKQF